MENKKDNDSPYPNLIVDFALFNQKLNKTPEDLQAKYQSKLKKIESELNWEKPQDEKVENFYQLFAEFIEESNPVKMLYQILLEEYVKLEIFNKADYDSLKKSAVQKIHSILKQGEWSGFSNSEKRAQFRFGMLKEIRQIVHVKAQERGKNGEKIAALCFSGGGIRSATFGLGILQGLAKHNLLSKFDYLSTVSGGGYIGGWFSAWMQRVNNGQTNGPVEAANFTNENAQAVEQKLNKQTADMPEPPEITHLRSYSNYMSPRPGLFSADTWALIAVYLRNLLLNWTVFVPLIAALLLLPKIFVTVLSLHYQGDFQYVLLFAGSAAGLVGVININAMRPSLQKYSWVDQTFKIDNIGIINSVETKVLGWVLAWLLVLAFSLTTFWMWNGGIGHFPGSLGIANFFSIENLKLVDFILFSVLLGLVGYLLCWILFGLRKYLWLPLQKYFYGTKMVKPTIPETSDLEQSFWKKFGVFAEPFYLIVSGVVGGGLLYLAVVYLPDLNKGFYSILPVSLAGPEPGGLTPAFVACFGAPLFLLVFLLSTTLFVGLVVSITNDEDREWVARLGAWVLMVIVGWSMISTAVIFGPQIFSQNWIGKLFTAVGGFSGLVTLVLGFSNKSSAKTDEEPKSKKSFLLWFAPAVAAPIFVLFLIILISYATDALTDNVLIFDHFKHLTWLAIFTIIGAVMGWFININKFSFHSIYRERLIRAYLGASRTKQRLSTANSFTGLDSEHDNLEMNCLRQRPFHVVNMTLNLVKTHNLRWQNRKAESFTATALYCGSSNMGEGSGNYRSSQEYGLFKQNGRAITLGTAAAISGAAASPNMGYYTMSSAVSFLMVLFNVRLGWWLGNPGSRGQKTYKLPAPRWSPRLFLDESIGGTDDSKPYIYLSDGGHFDNLGLYEMVLRRCSLIVVSDAACDADFGFSDFGTAIHKIRVDMGIPIEFDQEKSPVQTRNCGIGRIRYSVVDPEVNGKKAEDGILLYIKPTLDGDEPIDIKNYKRENKAFPHESTADQMYSETQFESYRSLGFHQISSICCHEETCSCLNLAKLVDNAENYLKTFQKKGKDKAKEQKKEE